MLEVIFTIWIEIEAHLMYRKIDKEVQIKIKPRKRFKSKIESCKRMR
jgi:hypothetical protein